MNKTIHRKKILVNIFSFMAIVLFILPATTTSGNFYPQKESSLSFSFYLNNIEKTCMTDSGSMGNHVLITRFTVKAGKEIILNEK
jgi:hypothetical protein